MRILMIVIDIVMFFMMFMRLRREINEAYMPLFISLDIQLLLCIAISCLSGPTCW